jgi:hypothetical protein
MQWIHQMGIPTYFYSDGGPHFTGRVMKELMSRLKNRRLPSIPYTPLTNSSVERAGGLVVKMCQSLCSENNLPDDKWYTILPNVEHMINSKEMRCLGNTSPLEICTGVKLSTHLDAIFDNRETDGSLKQLDSQSIKVELVDELKKEL